MDYDDHVFEEAAYNHSNVTNPAELYNDYLVQEIILSVFSLIGIIVNILFIYVVCYFRKLHTSINIYLVNWAIADTGSFIITVTTFRIFTPMYNNLPDEVLCFNYGLECALVFTSILIMLILTIDWCLTSYFPRPLEKFRNWTTLIIAAIWLITALYSITSTVLCSVSDYFLIFHYCIPIIYLILFAFVITLHVMNIVRKIRRTLIYHPIFNLLIPTVFVICWFFSWINIFFMQLDIYMITDVPIFLHPCINFFVVLMIDKDFKVCFYQVFNCFKCTKPNQNGEIENANTVANNEPTPTSFTNQMAQT